MLESYNEKHVSYITKRQTYTMWEDDGLCYEYEKEGMFWDGIVISNIRIVWWETCIIWNRDKLTCCWADDGELHDSIEMNC